MDIILLILILYCVRALAINKRIIVKSAAIIFICFSLWLIASVIPEYLNKHVQAPVYISSMSEHITRSPDNEITRTCTVHIKKDYDWWTESVSPHEIFIVNGSCFELSQEKIDQMRLQRLQKEK